MCAQQHLPGAYSVQVLHKSLELYTLEGSRDSFAFFSSAGQNPESVRVCMRAHVCVCVFSQP